MPQLDVSTYTSQLFWLFICFSCVYLSLKMKGVPRISKVLEKRRSVINEDRQEAAHFSQKSEDLREAFEKILKSTRAQAHQRVMATIQQIGNENGRRKDDISENSRVRLQLAEADIRAKKDQALEDLKDVAESVATTTVQKLIPKQVPQQKISAALKSAFEERVA